MNISLDLPEPAMMTPWDRYVPVLMSQDGTKSEIYLTDNIDEPIHYNEMCKVLLDAEEGDEVKLTINNSGGYIATTVQILDALARTKAKTKAYIAGTAQSAATFIALACDELEIAPYSDFMCHNYNYGTYGNGNQVRKYVNFTDDKLSAFMADQYNLFLTEEEIESISKSDAEIWLTADDVMARWHTRKEAIEAALNEMVVEEPKEPENETDS